MRKGLPKFGLLFDHLFVATRI